jgi:hypothetical protein
MLGQAGDLSNGPYEHVFVQMDCNTTCMAPNTRFVSPDPEGGWDVKKPGASRASSHHDTQAEAQAAAHRYLHNEGGGERIPVPSGARA